MAAATHTPTYPSGATAQTGLRGSAVPRVDTSDRVSVAPPPSSDRPQFPLTPAPTPVEESSKSSSPEFEGAARTSSTSGAATDSDADGGVLPLRRIASSTAVAHSPKVVLPVPRPDGDHRQRSTFREHRKNALSVGALPYPPVPGLGPPSSASQPAGRDRNRSRNLTIAPGSSSLSPAANGVDHRQPQTARLAKTSWRHPRPPSLTNLGWDVPSADLDSLTARPSMLQSPCFFHRRFDDAVNLDRVVEEISGDEGMSHSRLMQTATGVREVSKQLRRRPIKRAVRTVMIVTKARDHDLVTMTRELAEWLMSTPRYGSGVGVHVYVDAKLRHSKRFDAAGLVQKNARFEELLDYWTPHLCWSSPDRFDLVLTLGGDGTVLFTSWLFQRIVPPVLSFSLGSLGFLTNFQFDDYREHLDRVMGDAGMKVNLRMRFTCTVYRCKNRPSDGRRRRRSRRRRGAEGADAVDPPELEQGEQFEVLNEVVIDRGPSPYVSNLELYGDDELLTVVQADGCIFSTPTGSTAYSLSAGGSLVHPDIPAILLTPICPHSLSFRPMLLNDSMLLRVCVPRQSRATAYCSFDGKGRIELKQGDHVTIAASQFPFPTVLSQSSEWFDSIGRTLRWNSRSSVQKGWNAKSDKSGDAGVGEQKSGERVNGQGPDDAAGTDMEGEDKSREKGHHDNDTDDNDDDDDDDDDYYNEDGNEDGDEDGDSDPDEAWDIDTDTTDGGTYVQSST